VGAICSWKGSENRIEFLREEQIPYLALTLQLSGFPFYLCHTYYSTDTMEFMNGSKANEIFVWVNFHRFPNARVNVGDTLRRPQFITTFGKLHPFPKDLNGHKDWCLNKLARPSRSNSFIVPCHVKTTAKLAFAFHASFSKSLLTCSICKCMFLSVTTCAGLSLIAEKASFHKKAFVLNFTLKR